MTDPVSDLLRKYSSAWELRTRGSTEGERAAADMACRRILTKLQQYGRIENGTFYRHGQPSRPVFTSTPKPQPKPPVPTASRPGFFSSPLKVTYLVYWHFFSKSYVATGGWLFICIAVFFPSFLERHDTVWDWLRLLPGALIYLTLTPFVVFRTEAPKPGVSTSHTRWVRMFRTLWPPKGA